ncbi:MAG: shikimate dehydrogenase, partial [Rhizobiales bacterium]|nr:shikimate dehydrogenase [Hyphomicrobiales bacterium]
ARGILHAILSRGVETITVANRNLERAECLARDMGEGSSSRIVARAWRDLPEAVRGAGLLVNATSLGMARQPPLDCPLDGLRDDAVVDDIVYAPLETELLRRARHRGLRVVDGLGMLLHQAAPGFERWFGVRPEVTPELRALIVADLEKPA